MQGETFYLFETDADLKIRFASHRFRNRQHERLNPAVGSLAWANQKKLAACSFTRLVLFHRRGARSSRTRGAFGQLFGVRGHVRALKAATCRCTPNAARACAGRTLFATKCVYLGQLQRLSEFRGDEVP